MGCPGPVLRRRGRPTRFGRTAATEDRIDQLAADVGRMRQEMRDVMVLLADQRQPRQDHAPPAPIAPPQP